MIMRFSVANFAGNLNISSWLRFGKDQFFLDDVRHILVICIKISSIARGLDLKSELTRIINHCREWDGKSEDCHVFVVKYFFGKYSS